MRFVVILLCLVTTYAQNQRVISSENHKLNEKIGNFSIELLYHTAQEQQKNIILSPITVWTTLAVAAEGAVGTTYNQIAHAIRLPIQKQQLRNEYAAIQRNLVFKTEATELQKVNAIFVDTKFLLEKDFQEVSRTYYNTDTIALNFKDSHKVADLVNVLVSNITRGKITKLVEKDNFDGQMILTSAVYFKGQWSMPFNKSLTKVTPFYNSEGVKIGDVNMMYTHHGYPFANIEDLEAKVIELPYGNDDRLSMILVVPNQGVALEKVFFNFGKVKLDTMFQELVRVQNEFVDDEVDCLIPRFKIESDLMLTETLKQKFGIVNLFNESLANLPYLTRLPVYVSGVIHKAQIEVTEEGTEAAGATAAFFRNRIGSARFEANRPFVYLIVDKTINTILFGGTYKEPSLF